MFDQGYRESEVVMVSFLCARVVLVIMSKLNITISMVDVPDTRSYPLLYML